MMLYFTEFKCHHKRIDTFLTSVILRHRKKVIYSLANDTGNYSLNHSDLQARIAFLQGERKGQENLKQDLVRRIKMLEFALKQER